MILMWPWNNGCQFNGQNKRDYFFMNSSAVRFELEAWQIRESILTNMAPNLAGILKAGRWLFNIITSTQALVKTVKIVNKC